jgi:hypothetical protein
MTEENSFAAIRVTDWPDCDVCHQPGGRGDLLSIDLAAVQARALGLRKWEEEHTGSESIEEAFAAVEARPAPINWLWAHESCTPKPNQMQLSGNNFETAEAMLQWTFHMMDKSWWFRASNWHAAVQRFFDVP